MKNEKTSSEYMNFLGEGRDSVKHAFQLTPNSNFINFFKGAGSTGRTARRNRRARNWEIGAVSKFSRSWPCFLNGGFFFTPMYGTNLAPRKLGIWCSACGSWTKTLNEPRTNNRLRRCFPSVSSNYLTFCLLRLFLNVFKRLKRFSYLKRFLTNPGTRCGHSGFFG